MNAKGIAVYLGLNYLLVNLLTFIFIGEGVLVFQDPNLFQFLVQAAMMGIPALCALVALQFCPDAEQPLLPIWPVPLSPATRVTLLAPLAFAAIYAIATALGFTSPQWNLASLMNRVEGQMPAPLPPEVAAAAPWFTLVLYPLLSILVGATLFSFLALGSEIGWRGYLLPRLMPLGTIPAHLITGLCWGLWFLPLVYGWLRETGQTAGTGETMLRTVALAVVLGTVLGQIARRTRHLGLTALCLGGFVGQASGIWSHLFQQSAPPWTGTAGWIAIVLWGLLALVPGLYVPRLGDRNPQEQGKDTKNGSHISR